MFAISFTGEPDKDGRSKRLARTIRVPTDSAAEALTQALGILNKQKKAAQDVVGGIRIRRVTPEQRDIVFAFSDK